MGKPLKVEAVPTFTLSLALLFNDKSLRIPRYPEPKYVISRNNEALFLIG